MMIFTCYIYALASTIGPLLGWGAYKLEGFLITCTYDFFTPVSVLYVLYKYITGCPKKNALLACPVTWAIRAFCLGHPVE